MKDINYNIVLVVRQRQTLEPEEINFLSLLLLNSKYSDNFNLNRSLIDLSFITKVKKKFSGDKSNSEMLVYYISPIPITRVRSNIIDIVDKEKDKDLYNDLDENEQYIIIGNVRPSKLTLGQAKYINKILESTTALKTTEINKSSSNPCKHYKDFHNGI